MLTFKLRAGKKLPMITLVLFLVGCASTPKAHSSINEMQFLVYPKIIERDGKYFLQYQIKINSDKLTLVRVVYRKVMNNKAYYFFSIPISHPEKGNLIERSLEQDGFTQYARRDVVYWLNEDQSEVRLQIVNEKK